MKKTATIILVLTVMASVSLFSLCAYVLRYAEGWITFYWDSHYLQEQLGSRGVGEVLRAFLLQYFAVPHCGTAVMTVIAVVVALLAMVAVRLMTRRRQWVYLSLIPALATPFALLAFLSPNGLAALTMRFSESGKNNVMYVELSNMARDEDWDGIVGKCEESGRLSNLLVQNFLNMALAERGELGDRLLDEPCRDIRSIYNESVENPDFAALLSDIFYSMGHIAQSQRYAFELNQKKDNMSPRLLKRLVQTNIIYGQYDVARKYLMWLKKTAYYKDWAEVQERYLNHDEIVENDEEYGMKRLCLIPDNRFTGIKGLDDDLLNIARSTRGKRQCRTTLQYLASLYLLAEYKTEFVSLCDEFKEYKLNDQKYFNEYLLNTLANNE